MANGEPAKTSQSLSEQSLGESVQAHLGKPSRFADGYTRNWSLFFFFRILPEAELARDLARLKMFMTAVKAGKGDAVEEEARKLLAAIRHPGAVNAGLVDQKKRDKAKRDAHKPDASKPDAPPQGAAKPAPPDPDAPAQLFLDWLTVTNGGHAGALTNTLRTKLVAAGMPAEVFEPAPASDTTAAPKLAATAPVSVDRIKGGMDFLSSLNDAWLGSTGPGDAATVLQALWQGLRPMATMLADAGMFRKVFVESFGNTPAEAGLKALSEGLLRVCLYEILRQLAPAQWNDSAEAPRSSAMRSAAAEKGTKAKVTDPPWDPVPINFAFTYSGLKALKLDENVLASFPDAFKEGMAARAERLGDTGPSAPENWDGVLGLDRVHGYFTGGFQVGGSRPGHDKDDLLPVPAHLWQTLREQVRAYNDRSSELGQALRNHVRTFFKLIGMDILHIELGEDPYEIDPAGNVKRLPHRTEHFGFRDGLSQPFVDLDLDTPAPGGGTPRRNRTWSPLAAGEIYLDQPDEDGNHHELPAHKLLRRGSTFLVFRKLEQDVAGFRGFLRKQRPGSGKAQRKLASQFVGRWPNGTPLVLAPDEPLELGPDADGLINDFLYAADDPAGLKCPLSAHVRRTNPRDIGGTNDVRRHRILRRGIGYGGPLLPDKVLGDGNKRGLLFIAANSRIDLQFEVIQSNWINKGELLGQAGLNRCPLTGANLGGAADAFLEAGAVAPVTGLPRFVITRGGDYFFAPGVEALRAIAEGCKFVVDRSSLPYLGYSMGDTTTPALFSEQRLKGFADRIIKGIPSVIRVEMPPTDPPGASPATPPPKVAFVAQLEDVRRVLSMGVHPQGAPNAKIIYSVDQYRTAIHRLGFGRDMLVATELGSDSAPTRQRMHQILTDAWDALGPDVYKNLAGITKHSIETALSATSQSGRIDLVHDLASTTVYDVLVKLYGTPGPDWLTELAVSLPFSHQHIGELQPDWLKAAQAGTLDNVGLATLQVWSILIFLDIVGNYEQQPELSALCCQAASELLTHLGNLITRARARKAPPTNPPTYPPNLLAAFVSLEDKFVTLWQAQGYNAAAYYTDVRMLLLELMGTTVANIPATMGAVMQAVLQYNLPLTELIPILLGAPAFPLPDPKPSTPPPPPPPPTPPTPPTPEDGINRLIYETCRLNGPIPMLMRTCMQDDTLPSLGKVKAGDVVTALLRAAAFDPRGFPEPMRLSLRPFLPGPERKLDNYLLFGAKAEVAGESRDCWGRDKLALKILKECVKAAGRLQHLQKVAGPAGEPRTLAHITIGLSARFSGVLPDWK